MIRYRLSDGELDDTAVLTIAVRPCTQSAPVANSPLLRTGYMTPIGIDLAAQVANGDIVAINGPPGYDRGTGIYTPPAGENGDVTIDYTVVNACRMRADGRVTIDVNQAPVGSGVVAEVAKLSVREIPVSQLASDAEALQIASASGAPAWVTVLPDRLIVTPLPLPTPDGRADFTVRVVDPGGLFVDVPVTILVQAQPPVANPDTVDVSDGAVRIVGFGELLANDSGAGIAVASVTTGTLTFSGGGSGTVVVVGGAVTIDPGTGVGRASFSYTIRNGGGDATSTVTVIGPEPPPPSTVPPPPSTVPPPPDTVPSPPTVP